MKKFQFTIAGNKYDAEIIQVEEELGIIEINGTRYEVEIHHQKPVQKTPKLVRTPIPERNEKVAMKAESGLYKIVSPLPGTIVNVLVREGDHVKPSDKVLTLEAMKMENNVFAEKAGVIKSVKIIPGAAVLQGDLLIELSME